jgi:TonB family protein
MKLTYHCCVVVFVLGLALGANGQAAASDGWIKLQTDNGELSLEMPPGHSYFFDRTGFGISGYNEDFSVREMTLVNAYHERTLVSFEAYKVNPAALDALAAVSVPYGTRLPSRELNGIKAKEIVKSSDKYRFVSYYFKSKNYVYVVSSASRAGETPTMKRFFASINLAPRSTNAASGIMRISSLPISPVSITQSLVPPAKTPAKTQDSGADSNEIVIVSMVRATYVDNARQKNVQGSVRLRMEMAPNGYIPKIEVVRALAEGLTSQALYAALRLKFLPEEQDGKPVTRTKTLEYTFSIY